MLTAPIPLKLAQRHIAPELRVMMEDLLFPGKVIGPVWQQKNTRAMALQCIKVLEFMHVREVGGNNHGHLVGMIQSTVGAKVYNAFRMIEGDGQAWCMSTMQTVICFVEDFMQVESKIPISESCLDTWNSCPSALKLHSPLPGTIFIGQHGSSYNGHTGMVVRIPDDLTQMITIEGNTFDPKHVEADGIYIETRNRKQNGDLHTLGFLDIYPA